MSLQSFEIRSRTYTPTTYWGSVGNTGFSKNPTPDPALWAGLSLTWLHSIDGGLDVDTVRGQLFSGGSKGGMKVGGVKEISPNGVESTIGIL